MVVRMVMMRCVLVVQPQQVDAVIVAVGRAHNRMNVELRRLRVGQKHPGVVIELDEDHRTLDAVVERARRIEAADPAEMRLGQMPFDLKRPAFERCFTFPKKLAVTMDSPAIAIVLRGVIAEKAQIKEVGCARQKLERHYSIH